MSDPAAEAARRTMEKQFGRVWANPSYHMTVRTAAAREALVPLRELHRSVRHPKFEDWSDEDFNTLPAHLRAPVCAECIHPVSGTNTTWPCATARLVYSEEELDV